MIDKIKAWLPFLAGLGLSPKIIVTLIVLCLTVLILIALWWPEQISKTDDHKTANNTPQKNILSDTPDKNQQHKIDENKLSNVELSPDKNIREVSKKNGYQKNTLKISADEYFDKVHLLNERFFERDEFIESVKNQDVEWEGTVKLVKKFGKGVALTVDPQKNEGSSLHIRFPEEFNTKCYSLRKGDYIKFNGKIINPQPGFVEINGYALEFITHQPSADKK